MNVFVVAMSAPAAKYASWISDDDLRPREVEQVRVALDVARVVAEPLAAVVGLGEPPPVDEHAPRPVVDRDPPIEDLPDLVDALTRLLRVAFVFEERPDRGRGGSLGVW